MIFDQTNGFRNDLSILDYIKECGALKGNGMAYYLDGEDKFKFRLSTYADMFRDNEDFRKMISEKAKILMKSSIKESERIDITEEVENLPKKEELSEPGSDNSD